MGSECGPHDRRVWEERNLTMELDGRSVIVTGAGRGIGRALALQFGRCGARVACCARRTAEIEETVRLIEAEGGSGLAIPTDVTVREQVQRMAATVLAFEVARQRRQR